MYIQPATHPHSWVLTCRAALSHCNHVRLFAILWTVACQAPLSMGFSSKNTSVGCHFLLQGIFPTQGSNPCLLCLLHWQMDSLPLAPLGKPLYKCESKSAQSCLTLCDPTDHIVHGILQATILDWVAFPFSRGSSQSRDGTQVFHIAGGFFTS